MMGGLDWTALIDRRAIVKRLALFAALSIIPSSANEQVIIDSRNGLTYGVNAQLITDSRNGLTYGVGTAPPLGNPVQIVNSYAGPSLPGNAIGVFARTDYQPTNADNSNSAGVYGDFWAEGLTVAGAAVSYSGLPAAIKGNAYAIPQITWTVASVGSGNVVGDTLTLVGGTNCTNYLNTTPTWTVTGVDSSGGVIDLSFNKGTGACTNYPGSSTLSPTRVGPTGPTLTLTVVASPMISGLAGLYGRVRNQSAGTITNAFGLYLDGAQNPGAGTIDHQCI